MISKFNQFRNFINTKHYKILIFILIGCSLSLVFRNELLLTGRPFTEDGYYSFTVARNLATGKGFSVGDGIKTNGFQPLFTIILSIPYLITNGDKIISLRIILFIEWIIYILTALVLAKVAGAFLKNEGIKKDITFDLPILISYIYLSSVSIFLLHFNGLETGLLLLLYSILWFLYQKNFVYNYKNLFIYSVLLGLLVLSRIDAVFFVIIFSMFQFFDGEGNFTNRFLRFLIVATTSFMVTLPWWLYNYFCFGSLIPSSGTAQQIWSIDSIRIREAFIALSQNLMPLIYLGTATLEGWYANLFRIILIGGAISWLRNIWKKNKTQLLQNEEWRRSIKFCTILLSSMLVLICYYTLSFYSTWFYFRYFSPLLIISVLVIGILVSYLMYKFSYLRILMILLIFPLVISIYMISKGRYLSEYYVHQFDLVKQHVPNNEHVGAFQSGTLGYFYDNTINLDGKTNIEALEYKDNLLDYIDKKGIKWLCDWKWKLEKLISTDKKQVWINVAEKGNFMLLKKKENKFAF